jgi:hypothetical protein
MRTTVNFSATAAYFERRLGKAAGPKRQSKLRAMADLYRQKASSLGHEMPPQPDEGPKDRPVASKRERIAAMFRTYGMNGIARHD